MITIQSLIDADERDSLRKPKVSHALFFAVLAVLLVLGYRSYEKSHFEQEVEDSFEALREKELIKDGEIRPTGGFHLTVFGQIRGEDGYRFQQIPNEILKKAHDYRSDKAMINHLLGTLYFFERNMDQAQNYYLKALSIEQKNAKIYNDLALIDVNRMDFKSALSHLQAAIKLDPDLYEARYNIALVQELMNHREKAIEAWQAYLQLDPDYNSNWKNVAKSHIMQLLED